MLGASALLIFFSGPFLFGFGLLILRIWGRVEMGQTETTYTGIALFGSLLCFLLLSLAACVIVFLMLNVPAIGPP